MKELYMEAPECENTAVLSDYWVKIAKKGVSLDETPLEWCRSFTNYEPDRVVRDLTRAMALERKRLRPDQWYLFHTSHSF